MPVVSRSPVLMFMRAFKRGCAHGRCSRRGYRPDCGLGKAGALEFQNGELQVTTSKIDEDYSLKRMIGQGSFATVYEAVCHQTGTSFACKAVCKEKSPGWRKEVQLCQQASATTQSSSVMRVSRVYETIDTAYIISDLYQGGDLLDWLLAREADRGSQNILSEIRSLKLTRNMLEAVEACHRAGLAHLDIKPENFVFTADFEDLVLVDFGSAEPFARAPYAEDSASYIMGMDDDINEVELKRMIGTAKYMSPEVWQGRFSSRSDVWSIGVILFALMSNELPFSIEEENMLFQDPVNRVQPFLKDQMSQAPWTHVSSASKDILCWMLSPDPGVRASTTESLRAVDMLVRALEQSPQNCSVDDTVDDIFAPLEPRMSRAQLA